MGCKVLGGLGQGWVSAHGRLPVNLQNRDVVLCGTRSVTAHWLESRCSRLLSLRSAAARGGVCRLQLLQVQNCDVVNSTFWSSPRAANGVIDRGRQLPRYLLVGSIAELSISVFDPINQWVKAIH